MKASNIAPLAQLRSRGQVFQNGVLASAILLEPATIPQNAFIQQGCTCHSDFCFELLWKVPQQVARISLIGLQSDEYIAFEEITISASLDGKTFLPCAFWNADPWVFGQKTKQTYCFAQPQTAVCGLRFMVTTATNRIGKLPVLYLEVFDR